MPIGQFSSSIFARLSDKNLAPGKYFVPKSKHRFSSLNRDVEKFERLSLRNVLRRKYFTVSVCPTNVTRLRRIEMYPFLRGRSKIGHLANISRDSMPTKIVSIS